MLKGNNIFLRAPEPADLDLLYQWENDPATWLVSNTVAPFSKHVLEQYLASAHLDIYTTKQLRMVICLNNGERAVGCIDLFDFDPNHRRAGIGVLIAGKDDRQHGYASEALDLLVSYCFTTLNLHQLYCNILADNGPSIKLFNRHGFTLSGIKKQWVRDGAEWKDEHLLQLISPR